MRPDKVEEEHEHGNEVVSRIKGAEALLGLVPRLELLVESLNEVIGNIVLEGLHADVFSSKGLYRLLVSAVAVGDDSGRSCRARNVSAPTERRLEATTCKARDESRAQNGFRSR